MKKILALVTFLVVAAACSTEPPATNAPRSNANTAPAPSLTATLSEADAIAKEKATWETLKKKDYDAFANMLAGDYLEIGGDAVYDKAGLVAYVKDLALTDVTFADWKLLPIDNDAVIVMYQVTIKGTFKSEAIPPGPYRAASAWVHRDGKWLAIFYQETLAKTAPPPAASAAAKSTAGPASKATLGTTGPDAEANEKLVWDAIKSKNYDAFGAMLTADFVEIEPDGVRDKAESTKDVGMFDASKAQLSDWKTVKFDSDASLVTYVFTMPGPKPMQERHTSIWVNRAGKWLALFHQGTPVEPPRAATAAKPAEKK
jgi:hypothetical protein